MKLKATTLIAMLLSLMSYSQSQYVSTDFGTNGLFCTDTPGEIGSMNDLIKVGDGYYGIASGSEDNYLLKLSGDGELDPSFGSNGQVALDLYQYEWGGKRTYLVPAPDDTFIVVTSFRGDFNHHFITRTDMNGNVITSFGENGYVSTWGTDNIYFMSAEIINNELVLVGSGHSDPFDEDDVFRYMIVMKYDLNGNPVTSFGDNGSLTADIDFDFSLNEDILPLGAHYFPDTNRLAMMALYFNDVDYFHFLTMYDMETGAVDTNFGTNGRVTYSDNGDVVTRASAFYCDGNSIYTSGWVGELPSDSDTFIKKHGLDGQLDTSFGNGGTFLKPMIEGTYSHNITSITKTDGHLTLTGTMDLTDSDYDKLILIRATENGVSETSFGDNGMIFAPFNLLAFFWPNKTLIENDNTFTIAAISETCSSTDQGKPAIVQVRADTINGNEDIMMQAAGYYPNPVKDVLNITSREQIEKAEVFDLSGKLLIKAALPGSNALDLSQLQSGFYIIRIVENGSTKSFKIIKE